MSETILRGWLPGLALAALAVPARGDDPPKADPAKPSEPEGD